MSRPARLDEIKQFFCDVDSDILWDIYMADICHVTDTDAFIVNDITRMFALILRRTHPEIKKESND